MRNTLRTTGHAVHVSATAPAHPCGHAPKASHRRVGVAHRDGGGDRALVEDVQGLEFRAPCAAPTAQALSITKARSSHARCRFQYTKGQSDRRYSAVQ